MEPSQAHALVFHGEHSKDTSRTFAPEVQTSWNQTHSLVFMESIPKTPRTQSEASQCGGSRNFKTKHNKLPSLIDR
jgi:hypothetical protein